MNQWIYLSFLFDDLDILGKLVQMKLNGSITTYESVFSPSLASSDKSSSDKSSSDK